MNHDLQTVLLEGIRLNILKRKTKISKKMIPSRKRDSKYYILKSAGDENIERAMDIPLAMNYFKKSKK